MGKLKHSFIIDDPLNTNCVPFVKKGKGDSHDYWCVQSTNDYDLDAVLGEGLALYALNYIHQYKDITFLNYVMDAMVAHGRFGPIEDGFFHTISAALLDKLEKSDLFFTQHQL